MAGFEEEDFRQKFSLGAWKQLYSYAKPFKNYFVVLILMMMVVGLIDASWPFITGWAVDKIIVPKGVDLLPLFMLAFLGIALTQATLIKLFINVSGRIEMGINYEIRKRGFDKLQELSFSYFDKTSEGWLLARMTSDTGRLADVMAWGVVDLTGGICMMLAMAVLMLSTHPLLGLLTLGVVPFLAVLSIVFQRKILDRFRDARKHNSRLTAAFSEGIRGARTIKSLSCEATCASDFRAKAQSLKNASVRAARMSAIFMPLVAGLGFVGTALSLWAGGVQVLGGVLSYGTLVAFVFASIQFFNPISDLARVLADIQYAQASAERVVSLLNTESRIRDSIEVIRASDEADAKAPGRAGFSGAIRFEDVTFGYGNGRPVLENFNLDVKAGESIALVGETGSGKSTIVNLACRFYEPTKGRILVDGIDYRERSQNWLHSRLGYVLQSPFLFSGSVKENIRYGRLAATDDEVVAAARMVNAHEFIAAFDKGYDTQVGEGGGLLSTGEKQLVSFARAILADPSLFVLDEATSSVDTETEAKIQRAIQVALSGRTSFIVAHRLSTIAEADRIIVLNAGKIEEMGSHAELLKTRGHYYRLYSSQFIKEKEEELLGA